MASSGVSSTPGVNFNYTYDGILERDIVFCPTVATPAISDLFRVVETARYKIQVPLVTSISNIVKKSVNCARAFSAGLDITNATISLVELESNNSWCKSDFEQTLNVGNNLAEEMLKNGVNEWDPSGTEIQTIIDKIVLDSLRRDTFRIFSWGDTTDADTNWNQLQGLWTQLIADSDGSGTYCVQRTSTGLGTGVLAGGTALTALAECYTESKITLKQVPNSEKYFAVTGSIYENLLASYEANVNGTERQFTNLVAGQGDQGTELTYRGIRVMPIYAWDQDLADPGNPLFGTMEHGVLYTTRDNHIAAIHTAADAGTVSGWFNRAEREYWIESHFRMGFGTICCDLTTISR
ncbi:MAG: hypothetical protein O2887_10330 [Bacteroidetes bacterium]|nr:hypothetical protein [Bacteroidota bacterium]